MTTRHHHNLKITERSLASLRAYPGNARTYSKKQIVKLADGVNTHGWINPIIIDETGMILAGHGRFEAAAFLGMASVPVIVIDGLSEAESAATCSATTGSATSRCSRGRS